MRKLSVFNHVTLDGFFVDMHGEMNWAHRNGDEEWNKYTAENAAGGAELLFGRVTYAMMASFWPTPQAMESMPAVAKQMNAMPKVVFSRTLDQAAWSNTRLLKENLAGEVRKMKAAPGPGLLIFGSGTLVSQLAQEGLIDEYQFVVNPIVIGQGRTLFEGLQEKHSLKLVKTRSFQNGNVVLSYASGK